MPARLAKMGKTSENSVLVGGCGQLKLSFPPVAPTWASPLGKTVWQCFPTGLSRPPARAHVHAPSPEDRNFQSSTAEAATTGKNWSTQPPKGCTHGLWAEPWPQ